MNTELMKKLWTDNGGEFHGPNVETGTMPESDLLPFLHSLQQKLPDQYEFQRVDVKQLLSDWEDIDDEKAFENPHPIFGMAADLDHTRELNLELIEASTVMMNDNLILMRALKRIKDVANTPPCDNQILLLATEAMNKVSPVKQVDG